MKALVTLDGSDISERIVPVAQQVCAFVPGAEIHLLTVIDPEQTSGIAERPVGDVIGGSTGNSVVTAPLPRLVETHGDAMERIRNEALDRLHAVARSFTSVPTTVHVKFSGHAAGEIIEVADEIQADLIIMATHGRSGLSHLVAGSVAEGVIRRSGRPVLVFCPR